MSSFARRLRRRTCAGSCAALLLALVSAAAPGQAEPTAAEPLRQHAPLDADPSADPPSASPPTPHRDPNDQPFAPPPHGQVPHWTFEPGPLIRSGSRRRDIQLTVEPLYATFLNRRFAGRENVPHHGGGLGLSADGRMLRWLWIRAFVLHSWHPVRANARIEDNGTIVPLAARGTITSTNFGASLVYPLDLGRFLPLIELGGGGFWVQTPSPSYVVGQAGSRCRDDGECDIGSRCNADGRCSASVTPELHIGLGVDALLGRWWSVGLSVRYYALPSDLSLVPVYIVGATRLAVRF